MNGTEYVIVTTDSGFQYSIQRGFTLTPGQEQSLESVRTFVKSVIGTTETEAPTDVLAPNVKD